MEEVGYEFVSSEHFAKNLETEKEVRYKFISWENIIHYIKLRPWPFFQLTFCLGITFFPCCLFLVKQIGCTVELALLSFWRVGAYLNKIDLLRGCVNRNDLLHRAFLYAPLSESYALTYVLLYGLCHAIHTRLQERRDPWGADYQGKHFSKWRHWQVQLGSFSTLQRRRLKI